MRLTSAVLDDCVSIPMARDGGQERENASIKEIRVSIKKDDYL